MEESIEVKRLPELPVEIWHRILALVNHLPGLFCLDKSDPFFIDEDRLKIEEIKANVTDRLALHRVCKSWRLTAMQLTCESIVVCCPKHLSGIVDRLERSKQYDPLGRGQGWWTRRVHFRVTDGHAGSRNRPSHNGNQDHLPENVILPAADLVRFFRCTPNLAIYCNNNGRGRALGLQNRTPPEAMLALGQYCGQSLRRIEWLASESPTWSDLVGLCRKTPYLRTLGVMHALQKPLESELSSFPVTPLELPHLRTLSLGPFPSPVGAELECWDPILSHFSVEPDQLPSITSLEVSPLERGSDFFAMHGSKLRSLRVVFTVEYRNVPLTSNSGSPLPTILHRCRNLDTLVFHATGLSVPALSYPISLPHLTRIGLFPISEHPSYGPPRIFAAVIQAPLDKLFEMLIDEKVIHMPALKVLRIRDVGYMQDLTQSPMWLTRWWRKWNARGVDFQDKEGRSFDRAE